MWHNCQRQVYSKTLHVNLLLDMFTLKLNLMQTDMHDHHYPPVVVCNFVIFFLEESNTKFLSQSSKILKSPNWHNVMTSFEIIFNNVRRPP